MKKATSTHRRIAVAAAAALLMLCGAARADDFDVEVSRDGGAAYKVDGIFFVEASTTEVWNVVTDYEAIPNFVPSMRLSRVLESRPDGTTVVEQEAVGGAFLLSKKVRVVLDIRRGTDDLAFKDEGGGDFESYYGSWKTKSAPGGTLVEYALRAAPKDYAPGFILRAAMRNGARGLLAQVRDEILRRTRTSVGSQAALHGLRAAGARMDVARPMR